MSTTKAGPETTFVAEPGSHDFSSSAVLDAPRAAIYRAYTEADLFVQWWALPEHPVRLDRFEAEAGGSWRAVSVDDEYAFRGAFHEVSPERIISTFEFEPMPGHVCLETATFEEVDGGARTRVTLHSVFQSVADRDGMKESGGEYAAPITMRQLEQVSKSL